MILFKYYTFELYTPGNIQLGLTLGLGLGLAYELGLS